MRNDLTLAELDVWGKDKGGWHGHRIAYVDASDADFTKDDVAELIASAESPDRWDGISAAILRLKDGRFVSFESFYGPTGTGFYEDAYGGDADIHFGPDIETVVRFGLTDEGRDLLQIPHPDRVDENGCCVRCGWHISSHASSHGPHSDCPPSSRPGFRQPHDG